LHPQTDTLPMKKFGLLLIGWICCVLSSSAQEKAPSDTLQLSSDSLSTSDSLLIAEAFMKDLRALMDSLGVNTSFFMAGIGVGNRLFSLRNNNFNAQQVTTNKFSFTPSASYYHKSGLGINATTFITADSGSLQFYQHAISPGYDYMKGKYLTYGISYTRYFTKDDVSFYTTPFKNEFFGYILGRKGWIRPGFSVGWANGNYRETIQFDTVIFGIPRVILDTTNVKLQDFSMVASVSHVFDWDDILTGGDNLSIVPQIALGAGAQRFDTDSKGKLMLGKKGRITRRYNHSSVDNTGFRFQAVSAAINVTYFIDRFAITPQYFLSYYFPESENKITHIFSIMAGVSF
jgi:hypothetical protein